jgi:hypothetical protein
MFRSSPAPTPWIISNPEDNAIFEEIDNERARGAVLISAALIDERLLRLIKLKLRPAVTKEDKDAHISLFNPGRPLSSHFARIYLGLLLQIYPGSFATLMLKINEIRNRFAHKTSPIDFDTDCIKKKCEYIADNTLLFTHDCESFIRELAKISNYSITAPSFQIPGDEFMINAFPKNAQEAYMQGCKLVLFHLERTKDIIVNDFVVYMKQDASQDKLAALDNEKESHRRKAPGQGRQRQPRPSRA